MNNLYKLQKKSLLQKSLLYQISQYFSSNREEGKDIEVVAERLKARSVLSIGGQDAEDFLQSLTTNDIRQLNVGTPSIFTLFLNARGRVIHDAIIYKPQDKDILYVECDISSIQALQVHMTMYRARKQVDVKSVEHEIAVWAVFSPKEAEYYISPEHRSDDEYKNNENSNKYDTSFLDVLDLGENILLSRDPRMWPLGVRVLAPKDADVVNLMRKNGVKVSRPFPAVYKSIRYKLGIGEGTTEIDYGRCLPAEVNGDFLNGIDSKKVNYIGHVGAKQNKPGNRLMPISFLSNQPSEIPVNTPIEDSRGRKKAPIGYLRGLQGNLGLGLMNVSGALQEKSVKIGKILIQCIKPPWWPVTDSAIEKLAT